MIVGRGDIATVVRETGIDLPDWVFFASGVSNSSETRESEYERDRDLLLSMNPRHHLVYFSTLAVYYADTRYVKHKLQQEARVRAIFPRHTIIRIGTVDWAKNPTLLINTLRERTRTALPLRVDDTVRYVLTKDEFQHWLRRIPTWSGEMNITGTRMTVREIIARYVPPRL